MTTVERNTNVDKRFEIEGLGIEPVPESQRHGKARELFRLWMGANIHYVVVVTGGLVLALGLTPWEAISAILVGNFFGSIIFGLASIIGPKTGTPGILASRVSFGQLGALLPKILSVITSLSWFSINAILATDAVNTLMNMLGIHGMAAEWTGLIIVLVLEIVIAIYGHATIIWLESYIAAFLAVIFVILAILVAQHLPATAFIPIAGHHFSWAAWLSGVALAFSFPIGWSNYASDYSRYFPAKSNWKKIAVAAGLGQFIPVSFCEILGVVIAVTVGGAISSNPMMQLSGILPAWFTPFLLLAIVIGGVAANVPNGYTAGLGLIALRLPISRIQSLLIIALFTIIIRIIVLFAGNFVGAYESFLAYMSYWISPWAAIVIVDYFMRQGHYQPEEMMKWKNSFFWYKHGFFWPGMISFAGGIVGCLLFSNTATLHSPLATYWQLGDFSFEAGLIVSAFIYWILTIGFRRKNIKPE